MRDLFQSKGFTFRRKDHSGKVISQWHTAGVDLKVKIVCKNCNSGWMSKLESERAMPAMTNLILGNHVPEIVQTQADSIALFAFKTAIIADHMGRRHTSFFSRSIRHRFAELLAIPIDVRMWLVGLDPTLGGRLDSNYSEFEYKPLGELYLHTCTFSAGQFGFQVLTAKSSFARTWSPIVSLENLTVPLFPRFPSGVSWPLPNILRAPSHFDALSKRWSSVNVK